MDCLYARQSLRVPQAPPGILNVSLRLDRWQSRENRRNLICHPGASWWSGEAAATKNGYALVRLADDFVSRTWRQ